MAKRNRPREDSGFYRIDIQLREFIEYTRSLNHMANRCAGFGLDLNQFLPLRRCIHDLDTNVFHAAYR